MMIHTVPAIKCQITCCPLSRRHSHFQGASIAIGTLKAVPDQYLNSSTLVQKASLLNLQPSSAIRRVNDFNAVLEKKLHDVCG